MTYAISALIACVLASYALIAYLIQAARKERQELEDRLMSVTKPEALLTHVGLRDEDRAEVTYVTEEEEARLSPGQYGGWSDE